MFLSELAVFPLESLSGHKRLISLGIFSLSSLIIHVPAHVRSTITKGAEGVLWSLLCPKSSMSFPCLKSIWT